jgi:hypothetical protein
VALHPLHGAVIASIQPLLQIGLIVAEINTGKPHFLKPKFSSPGLDGFD